MLVGPPDNCPLCPYDETALGGGMNRRKRSTARELVHIVQGTHNPALAFEFLVPL